MKERYKVPAIAAAALATGLSAVAFIGLSGSSDSHNWEINLTCPTNPKPEIIDTDLGKQYRAGEIGVTCQDEVTDEAPVGILLIEPPIESA